MLKKTQSSSIAQRQTIFLQKIPQAPMPTKNMKTPTALDLSALNTSKSEADWQINWMHMFDAERKKSQTTLAKELDAIKNQAETIKKLRGQMALNDVRLVEMKHKCIKQAEEITELKRQCKTSHKSIVQVTDACTEIDNCKSIDISIQTDERSMTHIVDTLPSPQLIEPYQASPIVIQKPSTQDLSAAEMLIKLRYSSKPPIQSSISSQFNERIQKSPIANQNLDLQQCIAPDALIDHSYAAQLKHQTSIIASKVGSARKRYHCHNCPYWTSKKSSIKDHENEFCTSSKEKISKNMICPVCKKMFTYRGLRLHFNYYISGKHVAQNDHRNYSPQDHELMIAQHKNLKQKSV